MSYSVVVARSAANYLSKLDRPTQERIHSRLRELAEDPTGPHSKVLSNAGGRRASRVGDYRIVFAIDSSHETINVSLIGPRGRAYRNL